MKIEFYVLTNASHEPFSFMANSPFAEPNKKSPLIFSLLSKESQECLDGAQSNESECVQHTERQHSSTKEQ